MAFPIFEESVVWITHLLTGPSAQIVAVLAVGAVGLVMLTGRLGMRRAVVTIIGCFVVFGAAGIAAALNSLVGDAQTSGATSDEASAYISSQPSEPDLDPYAGAAAPDQSTSNLLEGRADGQ